MIDRLNGALDALSASFTDGNVHAIDMRGTVGKTPSAWSDEIHPKSAGYGKATAPLFDLLDSLSPVETYSAEPLTEALIDNERPVWGSTVPGDRFSRRIDTSPGQRPGTAAAHRKMLTCAPSMPTPR